MQFTSSQRKQKIESYGQAYALLVDALPRFPREMWQFRPAPGEWSIHEIVVHIADSEASSFFRCRRFLAEPGSIVPGYDEALWARKLNYHAQSMDDALELFKWLRGNTHALIKDLTETAWANTVTHSESGVITMDDWLDTYERHIPDHINQMQANFEVWRERNKK